MPPRGEVLIARSRTGMHRRTILLPIPSQTLYGHTLAAYVCSVRIESWGAFWVGLGWSESPRWKSWTAILAGGAPEVITVERAAGFLWLIESLPAVGALGSFTHGLPWSGLVWKFGAGVLMPRLWRLG